MNKLEKFFQQIKAQLATEGYSKWVLKGLKEIVFWELEEEISTHRCDEVYPGFYQYACRIYLDEYPEQEEMRDKFFYSTWIDEKGNYYRANKKASSMFVREENPFITDEDMKIFIQDLESIGGFEVWNSKYGWKLRSEIFDTEFIRKRFMERK